MKARPHGAWLCSLPLVGLLLVACGRPADDEASAVAVAEDAIRVTANAREITPGELIQVTVRVPHAADERIEWPGLDENPRLDVRSRSQQVEALPGDRQLTVHRYTLTAFDVGTHLLATGVVRYVRDDDVREEPFPPAAIRVLSLLEDAEAVEPPALRPLLDWPGTVPRWVWVYIGIALLAVALALLSLFLLRKRRTFMETAPPPPADETAVNALRLLREKGYIERDEVDRFYIELSAIVRRYIEDRFGVRAPELTTEEFIREASQAAVLNDAQQTLVNQFLEQSDLVKFARFRPGALEMQEAFAAAERLVRETRARAQEPQPEEVAP